MKDIDERVYEKLKSVPKGKITTYKDLSDAVNFKNGQRVIGMIMRKNPLIVKIPCHRVVMSDGSIGGYAKGVDTKIKLLKKEGVVVKNGKVISFTEKLYKFK